jgi:photosystem II stability/assembly factor-like uncharacterized protein
MIKYFIILSAIQILFCFNFLHTEEWSSSDYLRYGANAELKAVDSLNCMYVGYYDSYPDDPFIFVRRTTDGGNTWDFVFKRSVFFNNNIIRFKYIEYPSKNLCVTASDNGYLIRSTDNGNTWEEHHLSGVEDHVLMSISFRDDNTGLIVYTHEEDVEDRVKLFKTTNAGDTWNRLYVPEEYSIKNGYSIWNTYMINSKDYLLFGYHHDESDNYHSYSLLTTDGGLTWSYNSDPKGSIDCFFVDDSVGYSCCNTKNQYNIIVFRLYKTTNGGKTWSVIHEHSRYSNYIYRLAFADENNGILTCAKTVLYKTTDGGKSFIDITPEVANEHNNIIAYVAYPSINSIYIGCSLPSKIFVYNNSPSIVEEPLNSFSLHPNPATSHITLSLGEEFISEPDIDIIDYLGNVIRWTPSARWSPSDKTITINTSSLSPGGYFLRVRSDEKVEVRKFVVI